VHPPPAPVVDVVAIEYRQVAHYRYPTEQPQGEEYATIFIVA
jgi:hypothetical protein